MIVLSHHPALAWTRDLVSTFAHAYDPLVATMARGESYAVETQSTTPLAGHCPEGADDSSSPPLTQVLRAPSRDLALDYISGRR